MPAETILLSETEIKQKLATLPGWKYQDNKISKEFTFTDFIDAFNLIQALVPFVQKLDHHPDIHLFYNRVLFELQRFDVGGKVTDKDFIVAAEIERLYRQRK